LSDKRASRVLAALTRTTFTTTAPILEVEKRLWNNTSGRSVAFVRFNTGAGLPPGTIVERASLEVFSNFMGASGAGSAVRFVGIQWANAEAADGWDISDWPTMMTADAYSGVPVISESEKRAFDWTFALSNPSTVSLTGETGLFIYIYPDDAPDDNDEYFTNDLVAYDSPTGPPNDGDQAPKLTVYYCVP
jgi:hypothetical protein